MYSTRQTCVPTANFNLNGGEKGIIYAYKQSIFGNEIWMAFYGLADYERGSVEYSDQNDLVDIIHYDLDLDLRNPKSRLGLNAADGDENAYRRRACDNLCYWRIARRRQRRAA